MPSTDIASPHTPTVGAASRTVVDGRPTPRWRTALGVGLVVVAILGSALFLSRTSPAPTDPMVEMRKLEIEREIEHMKPAAAMVVRDRPKDYAEVDRLEPADYKDFTILDDDRVFDLRMWKQVPDSEFHELASAVVTTDYIRLKKTGPATTFDRDEKTSGRDVFLDCLSPLPSKVIGQTGEILVGADRMKVRRLSVDVSKMPIGDELEVRYSTTRWNSLQSESELWHGIEGYAGSFKVSMLVVFPENKPYTTYRLMVSRKGRDTPRAYEGRKILLEDDERKWLYWEVPNPEPGQVYRLHWTW